MWANLKNVTLGNNTKSKSICLIHLYEILEQVNLTCTDRKRVDGIQGVGKGWVKWNWKEHKDIF